MTYNFKAISNEITERGINLFGNLDDWAKGSMALSCLGDEGEEIFHAISSLSPVYNFRDSKEWSFPTEEYRYDRKVQKRLFI